MATVKLPDGKIVKVKDGLSEKEVARVLMENLPDTYSDFKQKLAVKVNTAGGFGEDTRNTHEKIDDWNLLNIAGSTLGGAGGAYAGALAGAAAGSVVPIIGTTIGGIAGGILGSVAGGIGGGLAGESLERVGADRKFTKEDAVDVASEEALWGLLPGVAGLGFKAITRGGRQVLGNVLKHSPLGGKLAEVGEGLLKKVDDIPLDQRNEILAVSLKRAGVNLDNTPKSILDGRKLSDEIEAIEKKIADITAKETTAFGKEQKGLLKSQKSDLKDLISEHTSKRKELESAIKEGEKLVKQRGKDVKARYDKAIKDALPEAKRVLKDKAKSQMDKAKSLQGKANAELAKKEADYASRIAQAEKIGGKRGQAAADYLRKQADDELIIDRLGSGKGYIKNAEREAQGAYDELLKGVESAKREGVTEAAKAKRRAFQPVKENVNQLRGLLSSNADEVASLQKGFRAQQKEFAEGLTGRISAATKESAEELAGKQQQLADLLAGKGISTGATKLREIEKQVSSIAEKIVNDFNAGKGIHPTLAESEFFKSIDPSVLAKLGVGPKARRAAKQGASATRELPTQEIIDEFKKKLYDDYYESIRKQGASNNLPNVAAALGLGRTVESISSDDGYAKGGQVKEDLSNKISKVYDEGYTAPGQAYAISKSMGYNQGGLITGYAEGGEVSPIRIKKANKGKFTASAKRAGMGVQEYANKILNAPEGEYSGLLRKRANFAKNASKWG